MKDNVTYALENWTELKLIESGATANIFLAEDNKNGSAVALKVFDRDYGNERPKQEAEILKELDHLRILKMFDYRNLQKNDLGFASSESFVLITEYASKGDLLKLVNAFGRLPDLVARTYFCQLIDALEYLHNKGIAHGDIKPDNVLVDSTFNLKLADFGAAARFAKGTLSTRISGTPVYFCPEKHLKLAYDPFQADIFSLGVLLFIMVSGNLPFEAASKEDELYRLIIEENFEEFWQIHEELMELKESPFPKGFYRVSFKELISKMLSFDPQKRCTLSEIKRCKYYQETVLSDQKLFDFVTQIASKMRY